MNFFEKRPLSIILCIMLGAFSLFSLLSSLLRWIVIGLSLLSICLLIIFRRKTRKFPILALTVLLIFCGLSLCYFELYFPIYNRVYGQKEIRGTVASISYQELYGARFTIKTEKIDNIPFSSAKLLVTLESDQGFDAFSVNDEVLILGEIGDFESSGDGFDEKRYYESRGIQGVVKNIKEISFTESSRFSMREWINSVRNRVLHYILNSANEQTAGLLAALITGERSSLPGQISLDFKRTGLSHILAVSGMHLAILITGLHKLLSLIGVDKKLRCIIAMLFVVGYICLTGFPVSVLRAGGMVLMANTLFLLGKTRDSVTNLLISVTAICVISPYAIRDTSLLLSFLATLGVLAAIHLFEKIPYHIPRWKKSLLAIASMLLSSFFAMAMTLPFSVFEFERLSYIAPITTLIFSILIEIFMYIGGIFLILGAPNFLVDPISFLGDMLGDAIAFFAELPNVYILSGSTLIRIFSCAFYILFLLLLILKIRRKKIAILVLSFLFCALFVIGYLDTTSYLSEDKILYCSDAESNDAIIAIQNGNVTVANMTNNTIKGRSYLLHQISQENILSIDQLWIPQYTVNLPKALNDILSSIPIHHIYLPEPESENEQECYLSVADALADFRCSHSLVSQQTSVEIENMKIYSVYRSAMEDGCRVILSFRLDSEYYTYIAKGGINKTNIDLAHHVMATSRAIVFGCRGRAYDKKYYLEFASPHTDLLVFQTDSVEIDEKVYDEYRNRARILRKTNRVILTNGNKTD